MILYNIFSIMSSAFHPLDRFLEPRLGSRLNEVLFFIRGIVGRERYAVRSVGVKVKLDGRARVVICSRKRERAVDRPQETFLRKFPQSAAARAAADPTVQ